MPPESKIDRHRLRRLARQAAEKGIKPDVRDLSEEDIQKLFYEFGVYQSELLAQNEELALLQESLEASKDKFTNLFNFAPLGYVSQDEEGRIVDVNITASTMLGVDRPKLKGDFFASFIHPDDEWDYKNHLQQIFTDQESDSIQVRLKESGTHDMEHLKLDSRYSVDEATFEMRCLTAFTDITELCRLQQQVEEEKHKAEYASKAKSQFLANMSHEIRTPMNGMLSMLKLLSQTELNEKQENYVRVAHSSADNLLTIINDILDLSRIEAGKMDIHIRSFEPRKMLRTVHDIFIAQAEEKDLDFEVRVEDDVPEVLIGDETRINQILFNLVSNAVKFTGEGTVSVRATSRKINNRSVQLQLTVTDTGMGISPDLQKNIFNPFVQADTDYSKKMAGTGLGLAITRRLVNLMNGDITLQSRPGKGSRFTVTLPLKMDTRKEPREKKKSGDSGVEHTPCRILLVEDNVINQMAAAEFLEDEGHRVTMAHDGREALQLLEKDDYDVVLMDVQMPVMDGLEATQLIRQGKAGDKKDIPIIAMTAYALESEREEFFLAGMDAHIPKPLEYNSLNDLIARVVHQKKEYED